jgi:solute carrier family 13 (sodium-dependent dicarboxylate transporter), member 2/3/5
MALLTLVAGIDERKAFGALADPIIIIIMCSLMFAKAIQVSGLDRRLVVWLVSQRWAVRSVGSLLAAFLLAAVALSAFINNNATTAILRPIVLGILGTTGGDGRKQPYAVALLLATVFAAWSSLTMPFSNVYDLMALSDLKAATGKEIGFLQWVAFGVPLTLALLGITWLVLMLMFGRAASRLEFRVDARAMQSELNTPLTSAEKITLTVLVVNLICWALTETLPDLLRGSQPQIAALLSQRMTLPTVMVVGLIPLFVGAGLALGNASFDTGLTAQLSQRAIVWANVRDVWGITALGIVFGVVASEFAAATAIAAVLIPIIVQLARDLGVDPVAPTLGTVLAINLGMAFPFSSASNAIVYATGLVPQGEMFKSSLLISIFGAIVIFILLRLILPIVGLV